MRERGLVAGIIHPVKDDADKPEFTIITRDHPEWRIPEEAKRLCEHGKFILDEKWMTVTCGKCNERVDAFAALMYYARNYEAVERRRHEMILAEKGRHVAELKRLSRLRYATDADRAEIERLTAWSFQGSVEELREAARRIEQDIRERKLRARSGHPRERVR